MNIETGDSVILYTERNLVTTPLSIPPTGNDGGSLESLRVLGVGGVKPNAQIVLWSLDQDVKLNNVKLWVLRRCPDNLDRWSELLVAGLSVMFSAITIRSGKAAQFLLQVATLHKRLAIEASATQPNDSALSGNARISAACEAYFEL